MTQKQNQEQLALIPPLTASFSPTKSAQPPTRKVEIKQKDLLLKLLPKPKILALVCASTRLRNE